MARDERSRPTRSANSGGLVGGQGEGRQARSSAWAPRRAATPATPRLARLEFPQGAVERIASAAGRKQRLQRRAVDSAFHRGSTEFDLLDHMVLVVAEIIDARRFAPPGGSTARQGREDRRHRLEDVAGNAEGCGHLGGEALDVEAEGMIGHAADGKLQTRSFKKRNTCPRTKVPAASGPLRGGLGDILDSTARANRQDHAGLAAGPDIGVGHGAVEIDRVAGAERAVACRGPSEVPSSPRRT